MASAREPAIDGDPKQPSRTPEWLAGAKGIEDTDVSIGLGDPRSSRLSMRDSKRRGPKPLTKLRNQGRYRLGWYKGSGEKSILHALLRAF
jgi:hypothetical protein